MERKKKKKKSTKKSLKKHFPIQSWDLGCHAENDGPCHHNRVGVSQDIESFKRWGSNTNILI